jgi:hypothetical protein
MSCLALATGYFEIHVGVPYVQAPGANVLPAASLCQWEPRISDVYHLNYGHNILNRPNETQAVLTEYLKKKETALEVIE